MADQKLTELTELPSDIETGDSLYVVRSGQSYKADAAKLPGGGDVVGPASATDGAVAKFDGTTGKLLKDGVILGDSATKNVGTSAGTVAAGDAAPNAHKTSHENGGADEISVAGLSGVLADPQPPIIGAGATQAVAGNDARLTDARTPTAHKTSHQHGGADEVATATAAANAIPKADASGKLDTWISDASTTVKGKVELATDGEVAASVAVQGSDYRLKLASDIVRQGFLNLTDSSISFTGTTFTLTDAGSGWTYWRAGVRYTITGNKTVALSAATAGVYFIYIDATDGTLTCSAVNTPWSLLDSKVPVATINYDSGATPTYWMADERHTSLMDSRIQYYLHETLGARLATVPSLSGYTLDSSTDAQKTFAISACTLLDQDMIFDVAALTQPNGTNADYVVWYRTGASTWAWKASPMPFVYNVGNTNNWIQYDNAGTMTDLTGGAGGSTRWTNSYLLVSNKTGASRFIIVPGRAVFTSLALAQAESTAGFTWTGFDIDECIIAYRLTWKTPGGGGIGQCQLDVAPAQLNLSVVTNASSGAGTDHATLANLNSTDYSHITAAQVGPATAAQAQGTASIRAIGTTAPEPVGTAAAGSSTEAAAKDHVHALPDGSVTPAKMSTAAKTKTISVGLGDGSVVIASGKYARLLLPYGFTASKIYGSCDASESTLAFDIRVRARSSGLPGSSQSVVNTNYPTFAAQTLYDDDLANWSDLAWAADEWVEVYVQTAATTAKQCWIQIEGTQT